MNFILKNFNNIQILNKLFYVNNIFIYYKYEKKLFIYLNISYKYKKLLYFFIKNNLL